MKTFEIIFSPTGGTEKVAEIIAENISESIQKIDLSDYKVDFTDLEISNDDLVIVAMPSFGGRAPSVAVERMKQINGNGAKCVLICVYGNRAYEDTLVEMEDMAKDCGLKVLAAIAAVAQHSIFPQYGENRPDDIDEKQLVQFAKQIVGKTEIVHLIPGNRPYKQAGGGGLVPQPTQDCIECGVCGEKCPVQAISMPDFKADPQKCISCMRCVNCCPNTSRKFDSAKASVVAEAIKKACSQRKENELFL